MLGGAALTGLCGAARARQADRGQLVLLQLVAVSFLTHGVPDGVPVGDPLELRVRALFGHQNPLSLRRRHERPWMAAGSSSAISTAARLSTSTRRSFR